MVVYKDNQSQAGFVSLFTVIFFMILITVLTVGFLRIITIEQRQALDNDLSASALAAAESGIEDGKRALIKYMDPSTSPALKNDLRSALNSSNCNQLFTFPSINAALGYNPSGRLSPNLNQYYTCLTVNLNSPDYISSSTAGRSEFIPLRSTSGSFDQIKVHWHISENSTSGDGVPNRYASNVLLPPVSTWSSQGYPAYLRVQLYGYPNGAFSRNDISTRTRTIFLVPTTAAAPGSVSESTPILLDVEDPLPHTFDTANNGVKGVQCKNNPPASPPPVGDYACTATIELPADPALRGPNNNYFLRVTPIYGASHFKLELRSGGSPIDFSEVQPIIDVTGRTADVFRRIQTRVRLDSIARLPEFSAETVDDICKDMQISDGSFYVNSCSP